MTRLEFEQNICVFYLVDHVGEVHVLDLHDVSSSPETNQQEASNHPKIHWWLPKPKKSARLTWALTGTIAVGAVGFADLKVSLADSEQAAEAVGLANLEVSLADSEQATEAVGLADWEAGLVNLEQAGVGSADFKVGSTDSE
jgi:hypothetical protein